jgi:hypothetical protein
MYTFQIWKLTGSTTVGWIISLPGNTPHVTATGEAKSSLIISTSPYTQREPEWKGWHQVFNSISGAEITMGYPTFSDQIAGFFDRMLNSSCNLFSWKNRLAKDCVWSPIKEYKIAKFKSIFPYCILCIVNDKKFLYIYSILYVI